MARPPVKPHRSFKVWISDTWALEIAALILSVVSLVAIVILLIVYDGEPQFSFGVLNLNTVIAILAVAFRIGFMVPVGEALAQWKWLWFSKKPRALGDFDSIDEASRGSRGSLLLLWETKGMSLTAIGAWIAILSLATEPFIQQIVTFRDTVVFEDSPRVSIPFAQRWSGGSAVSNPPTDISSRNPTGENLTTVVGGYGSVRAIQLSQSAQAAVQFGLSSDAVAVAEQLPVNCPSGNCTWPSFISLAVCSACTDISDMLQSSPKTDYPMGWFFPHSSNGSKGHGPQNLTQYYLPNGLNINNRQQSYSYRAQPIVATALTDLHPSTSLTFREATTLLFSTTILRIPDSNYPIDAVWPDDVVIEAAECGIYLCIKEYDSRVKDGILIEKSREVASTREPDSFAISINPSFCEGDCGTLTFTDDLTLDVDALFANETYFPRTDLSIRVPPEISSKNNLERVNISQAGIDSLSSYIWSVFDEGTFKNALVNAVQQGSCNDDGTNITCGELRNISGMAAGPVGNPGNVKTATGFSPAVMQQIWGTPSLTATFENLANSLTNEMRQNNADQQPDILGQLGTIRTVLQVRWPWIALPAFLLFISFVFFMLTIIESNRTATPLWKGSALAVLYHGLEDKVRSTVEHWELPSQMSDASGEVKVVLRRDPAHDALLLRTGSDKAQSLPLTNMNRSQRPNSQQQINGISQRYSQIPLAETPNTIQSDIYAHRSSVSENGNESDEESQ